MGIMLLAQYVSTHKEFDLFTLSTQYTKQN